jgi:integrase
MTERLVATLTPFVDAARSRAGADGLLFPALGRADRPGHDANKPWDYNNHRRTAWGPTLLAVGEASEVWKPTGRIRTKGPRKGEPVMQRRIEPGYGFHTLRHTYGSRLADKGAPRREIAQLMGHADEATTARYIHAGDDGRRLDLVRKALEG